MGIPIQHSLSYYVDIQIFLLSLLSYSVVGVFLVDRTDIDRTDIDGRHVIIEQGWLDGLTDVEQ